MFYHALIQHAGTYQVWYNHSKDTIVNKLLVPFVNGQVTTIKRQDKSIVLLNLRSVTSLSIYRTEVLLDKTRINISSTLRSPSFKKYECTENLINETKIKLSAEESSSLLQKAFKEQKDQVFVIMKFGDKILDSAYEGVIKPLFEKYKIDVIRVDEVQNSGNISDQVLEFIATSKYIFSELTDSRPNCYYETGFAHALGKEIILSCHKNEKVHFDLAGYRFITWETESELRRQLDKRIKAIVQ